MLGRLDALPVRPSASTWRRAGPMAQCVRLYSFKDHRQRYSRKFPGGVSSLVWMPLALDSTGSSVLAGFADGVVRILELTADKWTLTRAMKPHKSEVAGLSISPDGELLATGSHDATVFFFHCANSYKALGFCKVPGPVTSIDWAPSGQCLLVGCLNGAIAEVARPGVDADTSKSFELILAIKSYTFRRPKIAKPKPAPEVKAEGAAVEELQEADAATPAGEGAPSESNLALEGENGEPKGAGAIEAAAEAGEEAEPAHSEEIAEKSEDAAAQGDHAEAAAAAAVEGEGVPPPPEQIAPVPQGVEDEEQDDPPGTTYSVRALMYAKGSLGTFYVALDGRAEGYIYECHVDSEEVLGYTPWLKCVKSFGYTHSSRFILSGSDDGVVRVQEIPPAGQLLLAKRSKFWEGGVHDGFYGVVAGVVTSFDDQYLASVSHDGSFFVQSMDMAMAPPKPPSKVSVGVKKEQSGEEIEDVSAMALSIEEQRAKTEQDEKLRMALEKKNVVLAKVENIRNKLGALLKEMNERERNEKLPLKEFEIDLHVRIMLAKEMEHEVDLAQKELLWESEKRNVVLRKLKAWYLDPLEVERILLHSFRSGRTVSSFRTAKLSPHLQAEIVEAKKQKGIRRWSKLQKKQRTSQIQPSETDQPEAEQDVQKEPALEEAREVPEAEKEASEELSKSEQRRLLLKQREKEMAKYILTKPDETWVSEEDAIAIEHAENNKGDFKLKSDPTFVVPDDLRTNARIKRNEILLFTEEIYEQRMAFNKKFLALRENKKELHEQILKNNARIQQINKDLKINEEELFVPTIVREETPEDREVISLEDVKAFEEKQRSAQEAALKESKTKDTLGMDQTTKKADDKAAKPGSVITKDRDTTNKRRQGGPKDSKGFALSPLELAEQEAIQTKLKYEKSMLLKKNSSIISTFDDALEKLRAERFGLEINVKAAELKMLALYQELRYLQKIQPTEESLDVRLTEKMKAVADINLKLVDQEKLMEAKKEEIVSMIEKKDAMVREFEQIFPDPEDPQRAILHKLFLKLIRRVKRNPDGTIADSDEDSDLEETAADDDEDDYEDDDVAEVCPPNVTPYFYEQMFKLRERRVDQEFFIKEANKALDALTRERDGILKKKKLIDASLEAVEKDIANFQKEKQYSLNEIEIVLSLKMHQIEYLEEGTLPKDLSQGLVFDNAVFQRLRDVIKEHVRAKQSLKELHKELRKEHQLLNREKKFEDERAVNIEAKCVEVQMLKFGQVIDMEVLDVISKDMKKDTVELKDQLRAQDASYAREIGDWNKKIEKATDDLCHNTKDNAAVLHVIADVKTQQNFLQQNMKARVAQTMKDPLVEKRKHASEHQRLVQTIDQQDRVIQRLQDEIILLQTQLETMYPASEEKEGTGPRRSSRLMA